MRACEQFKSVAHKFVDHRSSSTTGASRDLIHNRSFSSPSACPVTQLESAVSVKLACTLDEAAQVDAFEKEGKAHNYRMITILWFV